MEQTRKKQGKNKKKCNVQVFVGIGSDPRTLNLSQQVKSCVL